MILTHGANSIGSGGLPQGYVQCERVRCISAGSIFNAGSISNQLDFGITKYDKIVIVGNCQSSATSWTPECRMIRFQYSGSLRSYRARYNSTANESIFDGVSKSITIAGKVTDYVLTKTNDNELDVNGDSVNGDSYAASDNIKIDGIFTCASDYVGFSIISISVYDINTDALKVEFIPVIKNDTDHILYERVSGYEIPINTSLFICESPI